MLVTLWLKLVNTYKNEMINSPIVRAKGEEINLSNIWAHILRNKLIKGDKFFIRLECISFQLPKDNINAMASEDSNVHFLSPLPENKVYYNEIEL